jgi:hypothetical protein
MKKPKNKKFIYHIEFDNLAWIPETCELLYGLEKENFNHDFHISTLASERLHTLFKDSLFILMKNQIRNSGRSNDTEKYLYKSYTEDIKNLEYVMKSIKYVSHIDTEDPNVKRFVFEVTVKEIEHTKETVQYAFETDYFNPDFGIDTYAKEMLFRFIQNAIVFNINSQIKCLSDKKEEMLSYYEEKYNFCSMIEKNVKFIEMK